ncbi:hypothetical protein OKZ62_001796 [Vibrio navarrensis]|nr:hypothetical protein [Vibrio navarrensis]
MVKTSVAIAIALLSAASNANSFDAQAIVESKQQAMDAGKKALNENFIESLVNRTNQTQMDLFQSAEIERQKVLQDNGFRYIILISDSMGESELKNLFEAFAYREDVSFVIRGMLPTERTITDINMRIIKLIKELKITPSVLLDPRPFQEIGAEYAPQILMYKGNELLLSASGLTNPNYLKSEFDKGKRGDLGNFGEVVKISEKDLTEVIRERASKLDKEALIAQAKDRYWNNVQFVSLPEAKKTQVREFRPELYVNEDIVTPDGTVIAKAGSVHNALEKLPFTQRLVIFDATDAKQLAFVKQLPKSHLRTKFITTRFDRTLKWDAVKKVENELNAPVYKLQNELITAFDLQVVPSVVTADNLKHVFVIEETKLNRNLD